MLINLGLGATPILALSLLGMGQMVRAEALDPLPKRQFPNVGSADREWTGHELADHESTGQHQSEVFPLSRGGVPRQMLMIDLNSVLAPFLPSPSPNATSSRGESSQFQYGDPQASINQYGSSRPNNGSQLLPGAPAAPQYRALPRVQATPLLPSQPVEPGLSPRQQQAAARIPQPWQGSYPSLGTAQLDLQLRRYLVYLETVGQPDILIVGGQGALQGVDPLALQASLSDRGHNNLKVFNWAVNNTTAQVLEVLLSQLLTPEQLPKLVIWVDHSVAFNGARQDETFSRLLASPGYRLLKRRLLPQLSPQDEARVQGLRRSLEAGVAAGHRGSQFLPESVKAIAANPSGSKPAQPVSVNSDPPANPAIVQSTDNRSPTASNPTRLRSSALSSFQPQITLQSQTTQSQTTLPVQSSEPSASSIAASSTSQSDPPGGFRLVNWCRPVNGPCKEQSEPSDAAARQDLPPKPAWLRHTELARRNTQAQPRTSSSSSRTANSGTANSASLLAPDHASSRHASPSHSSPKQQASKPAAPLQLPPWPEAAQQQRFLQALGFQSVTGQLSRQSHQGRTSPSPAQQPGDRDRNYRNFSLQGEQTPALHRLLQHAQRQDMTIAFVPLPLSEGYLDWNRQRHEQAFATYLDVAAQVTPLHQVTLPETSGWNDALFAEPHRLNRYGAAVLGWQIGQALQPNLLRQLR